MENDRLDDIIYNVKEEYISASNKFKDFNSAHEGWAVLEEEMQELWEEIRVKNDQRDKLKMYNEANKLLLWLFVL